MEIRTGTLDLSTSATISGVSTVSSTTIYDIYKKRNQDYDNFTLWSRVRGRLGVTGASVSITWEGCYTESGVTYITPTGTSKIRTSGTSVNGPRSDGCDIDSFAPDMVPFIKIKALHEDLPSTTTAYVDYALITD